MRIRVQYTAQLRTALGRSEEEVELPEGSSLAELLSHLATRNGHDARTHLVAANGEMLRSLLLVVNDSAKSASDVEGTVLRPNDVVVLLPPIAGG